MAFLTTNTKIDGSPHRIQFSALADPGDYYVGTIVVQNGDGKVHPISSVTFSDVHDHVVVGMVTKYQSVETGEKLEYESGLFTFDNGNSEFNQRDYGVPVYFLDDTVAYKNDFNETKVIGGTFKGFQGSKVWVELGTKPTIENFKTRYEYYEDDGEQTVSGSLSYTHLQINGQKDIAIHNLSTWNTSSHIFKPRVKHKMYTIRFDCRALPQSGNPKVHVDLTLSGNLPVDDLSRHHQSVETIVRNSADHSHLHAVFPVFADQHLFTSGAQFWGASDGNEVTLVSASILVYEH